MVVGTVAFDGEHVAAGLVRVPDPEVDAIPRGADLRIDLEAERSQSVADLLLERRIERVRGL